MISFILKVNGARFKFYIRSDEFWVDAFSW